MKLEDLYVQYDKLQKKYGAKELNSIYNGGCTDNPDLAFVFMNPTGRNISANKDWQGIKAPWLGTKNIWKLFYKLNLLSEDIYQEILRIKASDWTESFAKAVYEDVAKHKYFITNLGKCTQVDARPLADEVYKKYLTLLKKELEIVKPKVVIMLGNQVSSIILNKKISVSRARRQVFLKTIKGITYRFYAVYYPVGNGIFNMDKAIADIEWIIDREINRQTK
ncbi:MAG: hypothetical protein K2J20_01670 [Bacilli bacterium]|nr:hypothetical protein [Bacilli bacterium]